MPGIGNNVFFLYNFLLSSSNLNYRFVPLLSNAVNIKTVGKLCPSVHAHTVYSKVLGECLCNFVFRISIKGFLLILLGSVCVEYLK